MKGSLQLKRGIWQAVISYKDETGKFKTKWISTGLPERGNKKAAKEFLDKELEKFENNLIGASNSLPANLSYSSENRLTLTNAESQAKILFSDWLYRYIETKKDVVAPEVYENYSVYLFKVIKEFFDKKSITLENIATKDIADFYDSLRERGNKNVTVKRYSEIIRPALEKAKLEKFIPENPHVYIKPIKREKYRAQYFTAEGMEKFFQVIRGHRLELVFKMAAYYGFRRSELLGLRWDSIDFTNKIISVNHKIIMTKKQLYLSDTLKTASSCRSLPLLPEIEQELIKRKSQIEGNKKFFKGSYDKRYVDYVFVDESGKIILPDVVSHWFARIIKDNGLKRIRFHDLRHSCASIMLANGVQMKQIQEWLGHSNFATTADIYSHLDYSSKLESAKVISNALKPKEKVSIDKESRMHAFMEEMGFTTEDEAIEYLESKLFAKKERQKEETEM